MKLKTPTGIEIEVAVTGTQEEPTIEMTTQVLRGTKIGGKGQIAASQKGGEVDSLYFKPAFFRVDLEKVREEIAKLPHKIYMARKEKHTGIMGGCEISVWNIEGKAATKTGRWLTDGELGSFLDSRGITEIETLRAVEMWSEENETPEKLVVREAENAKMGALAQQWADEEEMEA